MRRGTLIVLSGLALVMAGFALNTGVSPDELSGGIVCSRDVANPRGYWDEQTDLYAVSADGTAWRRVTNTPRSDESDADLSLDGQTVVYWDYVPDFEDRAGVFAMNTDGTGVHRIEGTTVDDLTPRVSPDGHTIAFVRAPETDTGPQPLSKVFVTEADDSVRRVTRWDGNERDPSWSPDGTKIAFVGTRKGRDDIYVVDAGGSRLRRLTSGTRGTGIEGTDWSPDGTRIAFSRYFDGKDRDEIYVIGADGSNEVRVTDNPGPDQEPAWSPDSSQILYSRGEGAAPLYIVDADGSRRHALGTHPCYNPAWT